MLRRPYVLALVPVLALTLAGGCTGDDPTPASPNQDAGTPPDSGTTPPTDGAPPEDAPSTAATMTIDPPLVRVLQNKTANATITLTRNSLAGDVNVTIDGLPTGVTATVPPIAAGTTTAQATFTTTPTATIGSGTFTMKATGVTDATGTIVVAGAPGSLDTTFDQDGLRLDGSLSATGVFYAVAVQPDGKIVAAGSPNASGGGWTVRRYNADGSPDATFNSNVTAAAILPAAGAARGIAFDPMKGRIVVVGSHNAFNSTGERLAIVRLNADGSADQAFGSGGAVLMGSVEDSQGSRGYSVIVNPDSTILVAGMRNFQASASTASVRKFDATGQVASMGFAEYQSPSQPRTFTGMFPLAQGAFIATGTDNTVSPPQQQAVRFTANGTPDATFGTSGFRGYAQFCNGLGAAMMKGGDVVIVGQEISGPGFCETRIAGSTNGNIVWSKTIGIGNSANFFGATAGGMPSTSDTSYAVGHGGGSQDKYGLVTHRDAAGNFDANWGSGGQLHFEDPNTPDLYGFQFFAATSTPDGRLTIAGFRTGQGAGYLLMRIWE